MTADQSPPAFAEMGEEIAKGWESLQEDMQRLIMDPPGTEPAAVGAPRLNIIRPGLSSTTAPFCLSASVPRARPRRSRPKNP